MIKRPFFKYYGGKFRVAKKYPAPEHDIIIEPFAGAAGYSCRHFDKEVRLYDLDEKIVGVWDYLISSNPDDIRRLPLIRNDQTVDELKICQEASWLVGFWVNSGVTQPRKRPSAWMRSGKKPGSFWGPQVREMLAVQSEKIKHWKVYHQSFDFILQDRATWFIDPPYQNQGSLYKHGSKNIDYNALGRWCRSLSGQVMVCESEGADWLPFKKFADIRSMTTKNGKGRSPEVLWTKKN